MSVEHREGRQHYDVLIQDRTYVETVKERWKTITPDQFHVLADFDRTLTMGNVDGERSASVIAQIRNGTYLSERYTAEAHRLFEQYHPIEVDESLPLDLRIASMKEWWQKHFALLAESGLTRDIITQIAAERPMHFRDGVETLLSTLQQHGVPLVLLSAAPGDMIAAYLQHAGFTEQTIHILATMYRFDTSGNVLGVQEPIIHSLNKHEVVLDEHPAHADIANRTHVLLLGDGIGDIGMIEGFDYESLLKVGFLNENIEQNKTAFMDAYDMVITHDGPMTPVNNLLHETIFQHT